MNLKIHEAIRASTSVPQLHQLRRVNQPFPSLLVLTAKSKLNNHLVQILIERSLHRLSAQQATAMPREWRGTLTCQSAQQATASNRQIERTPAPLTCQSAQQAKLATAQLPEILVNVRRYSVNLGKKSAAFRYFAHFQALLRQGLSV